LLLLGPITGGPLLLTGVGGHLGDIVAKSVPQTIQLDFRGPILSAVESCPNPNRGPLRGFICEEYSPVAPPLVMAFTRLVPLPT
jgi:hypothetical protein